MILTLFDNDNKLDYTLPKRISGKYIISTKDDEENIVPLISVYGEDGEWFIRINKNIVLKDDDDNLVSKIQLKPCNMYKIYKNDLTTALLFIEDESEGTYKFQKYVVKNKEIKIGSNKKLNIGFKSKLVSSLHCYIKYDDSNSQAVVIDCDSLNGTYVNGKK